MWCVYCKWNYNDYDSVEGNAEVEVTTYHAENLVNRNKSGSAIILTDRAKAIIRYIIFNSSK